MMVFIAGNAVAQMRGKMGSQMNGARGEMRGDERPAQDFVERKSYDVKATGLSASFAPGVNCPPIASPYGSPDRFDGSPRRQDRNSGLHGGLDISLAEATPLLAVAAGEVVAKGEGGNLEGNYLWLRHTPEDTGHHYQALSKYQHLVEVPQIVLGTRVAAGEEIARSGLTGTIGKAFGPQGYPHLHWSYFIGTAPDYVPGTTNGTESAPYTAAGKLFDPMMIYLPPEVDPAQLESLSPEARVLLVAAVIKTGERVPAGNKLVWPVYCERR